MFQNLNTFIATVEDGSKLLRFVFLNSFSIFNFFVMIVYKLVTKLYTNAFLPNATLAYIN